MKQNHVKKLNLGKKTITRLTDTDAKAVNGGSFVSVIYYTSGCQTDFTRPGTTVMTSGTSVIHP